MGIYVWGTGCGASELLEQGFALERVETFVDSFPMGETFLDKPVIIPGFCRSVSAAASPNGWTPYPAGKGSCP